MQGDSNPQVPSDEEEVRNVLRRVGAVSKLTRTLSSMAGETRASDPHAAIPITSALPLDHCRVAVRCPRCGRGSRKTRAFRNSEDICSRQAFRGDRPVRKGRDNHSQSGWQRNRRAEGKKEEYQG